MKSIENYFDQLVQNKISSFAYYQGIFAPEVQFEGVILCGSFNPLHQGHRHLLQVAKVMTQRRGIFELSIVNADKTAIEVKELENRLAQFSSDEQIIISKEPYFVDKSTLFPHCVFVLGYDTMIRLLNPKYYGGDVHQLYQVLGQIRKNDCRFLVAGRKVNDEFKTLSDINIDPKYRDLFTEIPEKVFREDISSSQLRANR